MEKSESYIDIAGDKFYYLPSKGKFYLHRLDGPAYEGANGTKEWWVNNKRHRLDGPAIERANGIKKWCVNGELHRLDGPAYEGPVGYKAWYFDGVRHRLDGPAIECADGKKEFWLFNRQVDGRKVVGKMKTKEGRLELYLKYCGI